MVGSTCFAHASEQRVYGRLISARGGAEAAALSALCRVVDWLLQCSPEDSALPTFQGVDLHTDPAFYALIEVRDVARWSTVNGTTTSSRNSSTSTAQPAGRPDGWEAGRAPAATARGRGLLPDPSACPRDPRHRRAQRVRCKRRRTGHVRHLTAPHARILTLRGVRRAPECSERRRPHGRPSSPSTTASMARTARSSWYRPPHAATYR